jgi:hypothetical protein
MYLLACLVGPDPNKGEDWRIAHLVEYGHAGPGGSDRRTLIAAEVKKLREPEAKERQKRGTANLKKGQQSPVVANLPQPVNHEENGKARDQAAAMLNVSGRGVQLNSPPALCQRAAQTERN